MIERRDDVTVQNPLFREVFWHVYAKITRQAHQNSIAKGDFIEFWYRISEGTEQIRNDTVLHRPVYESTSRWQNHYKNKHRLQDPVEGLRQPSFIHRNIFMERGHCSTGLFREV